MRRLRLLLLLGAVFAMSSTLAACGGGSDSSSSDGSSSSDDPQAVLDQTFSPDSKIDSADIDVGFDFSAEGSSSSSLTANLSGPVEGNGSGVPKFDLSAQLSGEGSGQSINFEGGATSTGDAAYISYGGNDYVVDDATFGFLQQAFASSSQQSTQGSGNLSAFKDVLTNLKNEGTEDVEGTSSVHISGDIDVDKLIDAIRPFAAQAGSLGALSGGANIPTPAQLDQVKQFITGATFDVFSGADDHLLRKLEAEVDINDPSSGDKATIKLSVTLAKVNESQDISAPENAKPLSDLTGGSSIGGLLGGLGGAGSTGGTSVPPASGLTPQQAQCLQSATTSAQIQACISQ